MIIYREKLNSLRRKLTLDRLLNEQIGSRQDQNIEHRSNIIQISNILISKFILN